MSTADFVEPDERVSRVVDAFERGEKGRTHEPVAGTLEIYRDVRGCYRWRLRDAAGGRVVANTGCGYRSRREALDAIERVRGMLLADLVDI